MRVRLLVALLSVSDVSTTPSCPGLQRHGAGEKEKIWKEIIGKCYKGSSDSAVPRDFYSCRSKES